MTETPKVEFDLTGQPMGNLMDQFPDLADPKADPVVKPGDESKPEGKTSPGQEAAAAGKGQEPNSAGQGQSALGADGKPATPAKGTQEPIKSRFVDTVTAEQAAREWDKYKQQISEENAALRELVAKSVGASKRIEYLEQLEKKVRPLMPMIQVNDSLDEELTKVEVPDDEKTGQEGDKLVATRDDRWKIFQRDPVRFSAWLSRQFDQKVREQITQIRIAESQQAAVLNSLKGKYPDILDPAVVEAINTALGESADLLRDERTPLQKRAKLLETAYLAVKGKSAAVVPGMITMSQDDFNKAVESKLREIQSGQMLDTQRHLVQDAPAPGADSLSSAIKEMEMLAQTERLPVDRVG